MPDYKGDSLKECEKGTSGVLGTTLCEGIRSNKGALEWKRRRVQTWDTREALLKLRSDQP